MIHIVLIIILCRPEDSSVALSFEAGSKMLVTLKYNRTVETCAFPGREGLRSKRRDPNPQENSLLRR